MDGTIIQQGSFNSLGESVVLDIRSGVDWIEIINFTQSFAGNVSTGYKFEWQLGMPNGVGIEYQSNAAGTAVNIIPTAVNNFVLIDSTANPNGPAVAVVSSTNATRPVFTVASIAGLADGDVVRIIGVAGQLNLSGYDFSIDAVGGGTFRIANILANAPGAVGGAGFYRKIKFDQIFYPARRFVVNISQAAQAVVTTSVDHNYTVGQAVRMHVPAAFGMIEMDNLVGNIVAITADTFTLDIDSSAFTAFRFPLAAAIPFTPAIVVPLGEEANAFQSDPNLLNDATVNNAIIGIELAAGIDSPAGQIGDLIFWKAGKSFNT
jgi:hypothetical protein